MEKFSLNKSWYVKPQGSTEDYKIVDVPYDAMIIEPASEDAPSGKNCCWIECNDYEFKKYFNLAGNLKGNTIILEFEGIYRNARIYLNNEEICFRPYGYTNFYIDISDKVKFDENNELKVLSFNKDQPNQRWYSGSGIIRPVNLYVLPSEHIILNSIRVTPIDYNSKTFKLNLLTTTPGLVKLELLDGDEVIYEDTIESSTTSIEKIYSIEKLTLWSPETPKLYHLRATFKDDVQTIRFGLRQIELNKEKGFLINGKRYLLKGCCIHSENGILGNITHSSIEYRKARLLKEAGYNAIRCAHNPQSKYFLDACDELGLLVMDEYVDCWYTHKTKYDYTKYLMDYWKQDLKDLIEKDYNHPSVVLYSLGNEVGETAQKKGQELLRQFVDFIHTNDPTRPTTCGVNVFFNFMTYMGFGFHSDKKADKEEVKNAKKKPKHKAVGSELFNNITNALGAPTLKFGAKFFMCDVATKKSYEILDVAGYNYGILRYKHDLKKYKDRFLVGSETFCADAKLFMDLSKQLPPRFLGDFVWSGMDYLGEVGVGSWVHEDITRDFEFGAGWMTAGSGRLDILGHQLSEMAYTRVAYGLDRIRVGVIPPSHSKMKHSTSSWKFSRAIESWTFPKKDEGEMAKIEVYSCDPTIEVLVNGKRVAKKSTKKTGRTIIKTKYKPGTLTVIGYDKKGKETAKTNLETSTLPTILKLSTETPKVKVNDFVYIDVTVCDEKGIVKPLEDITFNVEVKGDTGTLRALGNACPYQPDRYNVTTKTTYLGKAQAIVEAKTTGTIELTVTSSDGSLTDTITVEVTD